MKTKKIRGEKGYTGIDIAISVVVLFLFISLIAFLSYGFNSATREIELKSKAIEIALTQIEKIKGEPINDVQDTEIVNLPQGFSGKIQVIDYSSIDTQATSGKVKKITISITYQVKQEEQKVELSAIIT